MVGCVYRVHFQLVQMFESYCKLVTSVANQAASFTQVLRGVYFSLCLCVPLNYNYSYSYYIAKFHVPLC